MVTVGYARFDSFVGTLPGVAHGDIVTTSDLVTFEVRPATADDEPAIEIGGPGRDLRLDAIFTAWTPSQPPAIVLIGPEPIEAGAPEPALPGVAMHLDTLSVFIPKSIREPMLGDLCEDLERMRARGSSPAAMWWAVIVQVALLALQRLIPRWLRP